MAWPFLNVVAPNLNTGPGVAVPTVSTSINASQLWLMGGHFTNPTAAKLTVTLTDTSGGIVLQEDVAAGAEMPFEWAFRPLVGLKWSASGAGMLGHIWGYV